MGGWRILVHNVCQNPHFLLTLWVKVKGMRVHAPASYFVLMEMNLGVPITERPLVHDLTGKSTYLTMGDRALVRPLPLCVSNEVEEIRIPLGMEMTSENRKT